MPSQVNEEMVLVARDCQSILDICDKLADVSERLLEKDQTRLLESPQLASRLPAKERESALISATRLKDVPVIARIVCKDETNRTRVFYTTPSTPPPGVARANLSSIYSSFGRLTSLPLGSSFKTSKGEILRLIERALLRPKDYFDSRDSFNTLFESLNREPMRVKSLRAFIGAFGERRKKPQEPSASADAPTVGPLRPEALDVVVDEGEIRPVISALSLAPPLIVSTAQDAISRQSLASRPVIIGPPGSGKTTALIRRLDFKTNREALDDDEPGLADRLEKLSGCPHAMSWRLFTPTRELKSFLKTAVDSLAIPGFDLNASTWADERLSLAESLGLLRHLAIVPDGQGGLAPAAALDSISWYKDFVAFHLESFYGALRRRAAALSENSNPEVASMGAALADIVGKAAGKPLPWFRESLSARQEALREMVKARATNLGRELKASFEALLAGDPLISEGLVALESPNPGTMPDARLRRTAERIYKEAVLDYALVTRQRRVLPKESLAAKVIAFLGQGRLPAAPKLLALGTARSEANSLKRFKVDNRLFLDGYFETLVPSYLRFKRRDRLWYEAFGQAPSKVEGLELDVLILAVLEPGWELARLDLREPGAPPRSLAVARHRYLMRNQILVDDASDFSPIQLKAMASLAHPSTGAIALAADLTDSLTPWGLKNIDQLEWALPRHSLVELSVNFRQSRRLAELADALEGGALSRLTGSFHEDHGAPKPVLASNVGTVAAQAAWLGERVLEIRERAGGLASIGIIVPEAQVSAISGRLNRVLETSGVQALVLTPERGFGAPGQVHVLAAAQARGLEFEGVLLVDPPSGPETRLMMTRAAAYLGICLSGDVPPELEPARGRSVADWAQPEVPLETLDI